MKKIIRNYFNLNNPSFLLLILPYISFNLFNFYYSYFIDFTSILILFFLILFIDFIFKCFFKNSILISILFSSVIIFFYGFYFSTFIQENLLEHFDLLIRGRVSLIFLFPLLFFLCWKFSIKGAFRYLNVFLLIFSIVNIIINSVALYNSVKSNEKVKNNFHLIDLVEKNEKPVILIILDEYSSPDELFNLNQDSSVYDFSDYLNSKGWIVRRGSYSSEISTLNSISSIFNFNSLNLGVLSNKEIYNLVSFNLSNSILYDSLKLKNVNFINFGIFNIGDVQPSYELYNYPQDFLDIFFLNSILHNLTTNTNFFELKGFKNDYFISDVHNQFIFNSYPEIIFNSKCVSSFSYVHLYMPHQPYLYGNEFNRLGETSILAYFEYWKFVNFKLKKFLSDVLKKGDFRIILTGDHGYRGDLKINPNRTFTAFYGFSENDISSICSVQDLGILINSCY